MKSYFKNLFKKANPLEILASEGNEVSVHPDTKFKGSRIHIKGVNNRVVIDRVLEINNLTIRLIGDNKFIKIAQSDRKINNLKIVSIRGNNQHVDIGMNLSCGGLEIQMNDGDEKLKIGSDCLLSWGIKMRTSDGHSVIDLEKNVAVNLPKDIVVSDRVWIGEDVYFCKGSKILPESVVAANSVITKMYSEPNVVLAGNPSKIVKRNVSWHRLMPRLYNEKFSSESQ